MSKDAMSSPISEYKQIALRRRWFIAGFTLLVLGTVAVGSFRTTPVYRSTALILIEKEQPNYTSVNSEAVMVESSQQDYYQTQYSILQSRSLARKTLQQLSFVQLPDLGRIADPVDWFLKSLSIEPLLNTRLVKVHVDSTNAALSTSLANALADAYVKQNQEDRLFISKDILQGLEPSSDQSKRAQPDFPTATDYESLPSVVNNKLIQELKADYARLEAQRAVLSQRYTPKHPAMKMLESQIAQLKSRITQEVSNIARAVKAELSGQLQGNNIRIIDRAEVPVQPVRPRPAVNLALGAFLGLSVGFILAVLIDRLDATIKDPDDIEKILKGPFLGAIPMTPRLQKGHRRSRNPYLISFESPESLVAEAFRSIRTSVVFAGVTQPASSLLVTSTLPGEGKTLVACNLAIVFAQLGERVLVIDAHLRHPQLHTVWNLPAEKGLSSLLLSSDETASDFILPTSIPGVQAIVGGPVPSNPSELLCTDKFSAFLSWASQEFDRVILDGPSAASFSDALLLNRLAKSTLFVIRSGKTNAVWAGRAYRKFRQGPGHVLGAVVNQARWDLSRSYYPAHGDALESRPDQNRSRRPTLL